ncbi:MAG: VWA domain-containing protein, partial [Leptospiraceae bacterium]|nr:VWA domain-containing protein [Leptospiraceae bacterium]
MISFEWPYVLAAILPWGAFTIFLAFRNLKAFKQVAELTHPAKRSQITVYSSKTVFWLHYSLLFLLGLLLILAGSGMHRYADGKIESRQPRVYIVLDGSLSMYANDGRYESKNKYLSRIEEAKEKAETLISLLPDALFGMYSFSGTAVLHSLPTSDHASLVSLIKNFEPHNIESSGSMISLPLKNILEMNEAGKQITLVLFSDGENPQEDTELENVLAQYEQRKVRIFTIGLGKDSLVKMNIFHPDDILHGEADKRVIAKFETRLNEDNLEMIADRTNADYWHADDVFDDSQIEKITEGDETIVDVDSIVKEDLTYLVMIFAMLVFLIELYYWPSLRVTAIKAAKTGILFVLFLPMIRCQPDFLNAHYKNQDGIASDLQADFPQALSHFSESMAYKYRMHIPAYNQARVHLQTEKY